MQQDGFQVRRKVRHNFLYYMSLPASGNVNFPNLFDSLKYKGTILPQYSSYLIFLKNIIWKIVNHINHFVFDLLKTIQFILAHDQYGEKETLWSVLVEGWKGKHFGFPSHNSIYLRNFDRFLKMNNSIQFTIQYVRQSVINLHLKWIKKMIWKKTFKVRIEVFQGYLIKWTVAYNNVYHKLLFFTS